MPTRDILASFWRDWDRLTPQQQGAYRQAVVQFIADLAGGSQSFHPRLRVKRVQGHPNAHRRVVHVRVPGQRDKRVDVGGAVDVQGLAAAA
jgi:hypothetical protein